MTRSKNDYNNPKIYKYWWYNIIKERKRKKQENMARSRVICFVLHCKKCLCPLLHLRFPHYSSCFLISSVLCISYNVLLDGTHVFDVCLSQRKTKRWCTDYYYYKIQLFFCPLNMHLKGKQEIWFRLQLQKERRKCSTTLALWRVNESNKMDEQEA